MTGTGRYSDDPRLDRAMHWALAGLVTAGLFWFHNTLQALSSTVGDLKGAVLVLKVSQDRVTDHEARIRTLENK